ncbi:unnamed protein product [Sympodiomycopsis kandeliae]
MSQDGLRDQLALFSPVPSNVPRVCTIAGSDSGGGAGIQADLKTFLALGAYGLSIVTALTAQNTTGVSAIHIPPSDFLKAQIKSIRDDIRVDAWKIGMLANSEVISIVAQELKAIKGAAASSLPVPIVLDPVMVSTSGSLLLSHDSIHNLIKELLPLCTLLTPNLPEAKQLLAHSSGRSPHSEDRQLQTVQELLIAAKDLCQLGPKAVLVKGGHNAMAVSAFEDAMSKLIGSISRTNASATPRFEEDEDAFATGAQVTSSKLPDDLNGASFTCVRADTWPNSLFLDAMLSSRQQDYEVVLDVLYDSTTNAFTCFVKRKIEKTCTHGTGCTLSSALAANLSVHQDAKKLYDVLPRDVWKSINYVQASIIRGFEDLGAGPGALGHGVGVQPSGILTPTAKGLYDKSESEIDDVTELSAKRLEASLGDDPTPFTTRLISRSLPLWEKYVWHTFIQRLSHGLTKHTEPSATVDRPLCQSAFVHFLKQDYHFLLHYSRVWSLAATQYSTTFKASQLYNTLSSAMAFEASSHVQLCEQYFGIPKRELEEAAEGKAVMSYTRFVLDVGRQGELQLLTATLPCLLGYAEMALRLRRASEQHSQNNEDPLAAGLKHWSDLYTGQEYTQAVKAGLAHIESVVLKDRPSPEQMRGLQKIWNAAVRLEIGMWDESLRCDQEDWEVFTRD